MFNYIFVSAIVMVIMLVLMYLDTKLFDDHKSKLTYFKNLTATALLASASIYLGGLFGSVPNIMSSGPGTTYLADVGQHIINGSPNF